jgi:dTDP-4-amino-4,6-dideoxygalactose transaminase
MQASFASIKLKYLDKWNNRNREIAKYYTSELKGIVELPLENAEERSVYHNYVIRFTKRDELIAHMERKGVEAKIHYPVPIHLQAPAKKDGYKLGDFPNSERLSAEILSLPIYPELSDTDVQHVASAVKSYFG